MNIADAYPNSAISAGAMTAIALVTVAALALWLAMVYLAERSSEKDSRRPAADLPAVAAPRQPAEDEHIEPGSAPVGQRHGAAA